MNCLRNVCVIAALALMCQACQNEPEMITKEDMEANLQNIPMSSTLSTKEMPGEITITVEVLDTPRTIEFGHVDDEEWLRATTTLTFEASASATFKAGSGDEELLFSDRVLEGTYKVLDDDVNSAVFNGLSLSDEEVSISYEIANGSLGHTIREGHNFEIRSFIIEDRFKVFK